MSGHVRARDEGTLFGNVKPERTPRANPLWDEVVKVFGMQPPEGKKLTKTQSGRIGKVVADLKALGARPEEIAVRLERYKAEWPKAAATPEALAKHWTMFATDKTSANDEGEIAIWDDTKQLNPAEVKRQASEVF